MAQEFSHRVQVHARLNQPRSEMMPEIMPAEFLDLGKPQDRCPGLFHVVQWSARFGGEDIDRARVALRLP